MLDPRVFAYMQREWGITFQTDRLYFNNNQVARYYSLYWTPPGAGINAFHFEQSEWCNSVQPNSQGGAAHRVRHAMACRARIALICPPLRRRRSGGIQSHPTGHSFTGEEVAATRLEGRPVFGRGSPTTIPMPQAPP
jgi:hypothetical protein